MRPPPARLPPWRVFFPAAALAGATTVALTLAARNGAWAPPGPWDVARWHVHEMLWGHVLAAFVGVLTTALPRWTGCPPLTPATVVTLAALWLVARLGALFDPTGWSLFASPTFVAAAALVAARRILPSDDGRDRPLLALLALLAVADGAVVADVRPDVALRLGLAAMLGIAAVMGGRIAPALTRHLALGRGRDLDVAVPPGRDRAVALVTAAALLAWVAGATGPLVAVLWTAAALLHLLRIAHWHGHTSLARPSILALHVGYAGLALGFALLATDAFGAGPGVNAVETLGSSSRLADAGLHAWGIGVFGLMCFAVQASVARRHAGRPLARDRLADFGSAALALAWIARLVAASSLAALPLTLAALAWGLAEAALLGLALRPTVAVDRPIAPGEPTAT